MIAFCSAEMPEDAQCRCNITETATNLKININFQSKTRD